MTAATPDEVEQTILQLTGLDDHRFAEALADCIMDPVPDEVAAFRSPALAGRSYAACTYLIRSQSDYLREKLGRDPNLKAKRRATAEFIRRVQYEGALLDQIISADAGRKGILRNAANPRRRAEHRLWQLNMMGDVPKGMYAVLLAEEEQAVVERRRAARREAAERRRAAGGKSEGESREGSARRRGTV